MSVSGSAWRVGALMACVAAMAPAAAAKGEVWSLTSENDLFGGSDRNYTNGLRIERFSPADRVHPWLRESAKVLPFIDLDRTELRQGFGFAHAMFTPENITTPEPDPDDRPYAAWLSFSATAVATQRLDTGRIVQDSLQLNLGVVGPSAGGKFVQQNWHELINGVEPLGWDHQLRDEPGIELIAQRLATFDGPRLFDRVETDLAAHASIAIGNVRTYAAFGGMARVGFDLDSDFGPPRIRPSLAGAGVYDPSRPLGGYIFAGFEGRAVARDIFLDGNTFRDSPSVDKEPLVWDLQAGIAINLSAVQIAFSYVDRSEQFAGQVGHQKFGAVSISLAR